MNAIKNLHLPAILACPECGAELRFSQDTLSCKSCGFSVAVQAGMPVFSKTPETIQPWERIERGPLQGTPWRQANWRWLQYLVVSTPQDALYLDIGCGHGDFREIFAGKRYIGLDIVPYPEVDIVCDLTQCVPFKTESVDRVMMMNVLEHVYAAENLLARLAQIVKRDGEIWIAIPFMLKIHQAPHDFARYTPHALHNMVANAGLKIERLDGYYAPVFQLQDALGTLWAYGLPDKKSLRGLIARAAVFMIKQFSNLLGKLLPKGELSDAFTTNNPAAMGYLMVLKKA